MKVPKWSKYMILIFIGFIGGFLAGKFMPSLKELGYYTLPKEKREIVEQLDLYENYDFFKNIGAMRKIIKNSLIINDVCAETLTAEEEEMIKELDIYENYSMLEETSTGNEFFVKDIYNISEEEWNALETVVYINNDLLDYYEVGEEGDDL